VALEAGTKAPDFSLPATPDQKLSLSRKLHFPLLADFEPKGTVARAYRAYRDGRVFRSGRCS
jgi:peroxiredoxin